MNTKVYVITVKENEQLASTYEAYGSFENAVKHIKTACKEYFREIRDTERKNEFEVYTDSGEFIHTLRIVDLWLR